MNVAQTALDFLSALAADCDDEGAPDRAKLVRACVATLTDALREALHAPPDERRGQS